MLTVHDVAKQLKVTDQHIRSVLRKGELKAEMVGKQWIIHQEAVDNYIKDFNIQIEPDDRPRLSSEVTNIVALSFFSGAMGLDIGMSKGGINALLACEFDKACRMTINKNRPEMALIGDINNYTASQILKYAKIPQGRKVDIVFGGPPCQAFSSAGTRKGFEDSRGNVFLKFVDIITEILPTYVVIENVRGLLSSEYPYEGNESIKGGALLHILQRLRDVGYTTSFELYNAANFGAPQIRERVVIIACLGNDKVPYLTPTHSDSCSYDLPQWRTLEMALLNLPNDAKHEHVTFPNDRLKYYKLLKEGQYWKHLPKELHEEAMGKSYRLGGGKTGFYRRVAFGKPSPTLVTHPAMPATDLCHPILDRPLSVQEYKCIQEFPKSWEICGSLLDQYKQIGNAVPIALGEAIANCILAHMKGEKMPEYKGFKYSRYKNTCDVSWEKETKKLIKSEDRQLSLIAI
jgi:DNA (cytosine-5)-methyltransferase 1